MLVIVVCDGFGVPGNIFGALPEKIILAPSGPEPLQLILEEAPVFQRIGGTAFGFLNDLFPIEGII